MSRKDADAQGGDTGGASSSSGCTEKIRRSAHKTGDQPPHTFTSDQNGSSFRGAAARIDAQRNQGGTSTDARYIAGPSFTSPARQASTSVNPSTPESKKPNVTIPNFTPGTNIERTWSYMLEDYRNRTRHDVYECNRQRAEGHIVIDVPTDDWLAQCAPPPGGLGKNKSTPNDWQATSRDLFTEAKVPSVRGETKFYHALVKSGVFPPGGLIPKDTHVIRAEDANDPGEKYSPDVVTVYPDIDLTIRGVERTRLLLPRTQTVIDQKSKAEDPLSDGVTGRQAFGQYITYCEVISSNSHRTSTSGFIIMPQLAYFMRLDHSGIIVSKAFEWRTTGYLLCFLSRHNAMTPAERGVDTSVEMLSPKDDIAKAAKKLLSSEEALSALPSGITPNTVFPAGKHGDRVLLNVFDSETRTMHRILTHHPLYYDSSGYIGSAVRWWVGVDLDTGSVVFIKTYWRTDRPGILSESDVHRLLRDAEPPVEHTLGLLYGGDVPVNAPELRQTYGTEPIPSHVPLVFQRTFTHDFSKNNTQYDRLWSERGHKPDSDVEILPRIHHISVFRTVVRRLRTFQSTKELATILYHTTQALQQAYDANILHRNVTSTSVGIDHEGNGVLMNFDCASFVKRNGEYARTKGRVIDLLTGASMLLQYPEEREHLLRDDFESITHLLYYHCLRFRPVIRTRQIKSTQISTALETIFESCVNVNGKIEGGSEKATFLAGYSTLNDQRLNGAVQPLPLWELMKGLRLLFEPLYRPEPSLIGKETPESIKRLEEEKSGWDLQFQEAAKRLQSWEPLRALFEVALQDADWYEGDGARDQYAKKNRLSTGVRAYTSNISAPSFTSKSVESGTKRYSAGPGNLPTAKRQRMTPTTANDAPTAAIDPFTSGNSTRAVSDQGKARDESMREGKGQVEDSRAVDEIDDDDTVTEEDVFLLRGC